MRTDAIILGAGASGLLCAITAARRGFSTIVVDHGPVAGQKVRMAGGGKGNVTNRHMGQEWYVGQNVSFARNALRSCPPDWVLQLLHDYSIPWEEREYGQIFCTVPAARLVEKLVEDVIRTGSSLLLRRTLNTVERSGGCFRVQTSEEQIEAPRLVIALGSPAWPASGSSDLGMRLARRFGHRIVPARPVLVPLVCPQTWPLRGLAGISLPASVSAGNRTFTYPLLFTHRGLSGPAILQASCFWNNGESVRIDFLPESSSLDLMHQPDNGKITVLNLFRRVLPARLAEQLVPTDLASCKVAQLGRQARKTIAGAIHDHVVVPTRSEGMGKAEASSGGVETGDVNSRTMESKKCPGLYFTGEVLDITGLLGGYNLHWAWASGKAAGEAFRKG